ncbi:MAG: NAD(P)-dependent alcohol dehydrogenase, partial [Candidatus Eiseniibacteriota bacterium]
MASRQPGTRALHGAPPCGRPHLDCPARSVAVKAAVSARYGSPDVLEIREVPKPAPQVGEALVRVHAATVNRTDTGELRPHPTIKPRWPAVLFSHLMYGLLRPRRTISGLDFAGKVEAVGAGVTSLEPGERVFGMCPFLSNGAHAEYVCVPEAGPIASMPANTRFEDAVVCEGALYANSGLKKYHVGPGHKMLIYGASGAIGTAALQLAKSRGAEVTAVVATQHLELAKSLGADRAIDYTAQDFTRIAEQFDFIFDAVGKASYFKCRRLLKPHGIFMATDVGPGWQNLPLMLWSAITGSNRVVVPLPE